MIGELEEAVADHPFQESLWELLITALYRAGRQADALATYQRVRGQLAEQLGLDPGPQLQQLEKQVLAHDASLHVAPRATGAMDAPPGNLPSMTAELVGRDPELSELSGLLARERLVEIVGPGGVGKTASRSRPPDAPRAEPAPAACGWPGSRPPRRPTRSSTPLIASMGVVGGEPALLERLKGGAAVVILDNCEHVIDAAAALAVRLLDATSELRILCTSQVPLGIDGETVFELAPLALLDAVELVHTSGARESHDRGVSATTDDVLELCRSLDGLPLAIELAAARTRTLSIDEITRRLDDRFLVLSDPTSRKPERRRSLGRRSDGATTCCSPTISAVCGRSPRSPEAHRSTRSSSSSTPSTYRRPRRSTWSAVWPAARSSSSTTTTLTPVRYRLLDSIRAFALEAMAEPGCPIAPRRPRRWFADAAASSTQGVRSGHQAEHLAFARAERANIDAALGLERRARPLALRSTSSTDSGGRGSSSATAAAPSGSWPRSTPPVRGAGPDRADALLLASWIEASTGASNAPASTSPRPQSSRTLSTTRPPGALLLLPRVRRLPRGDFAQAMELTAAVARSTTGWTAVGPGRELALRGPCGDLRGRRGARVEARDEVEHWLGDVRRPWLTFAATRCSASWPGCNTGSTTPSSHPARGRDVATLGFRQTEAYQVSSLGRAQCQAGDYEAGAATLQLAIEKAEATGDVRLAALARVHLGRVLRRSGRRTERGRRSTSAAWHRAAGAENRPRSAIACSPRWTPPRGRRAPRTARRDPRGRATRGDAHVEVFALDALARIAADAGDAPRHELCEAADRGWSAASHFITDRDRVDAH